MEDLFVGNRISLTFDDVPRDHIIATVTRTFSDSDEGFGPEIEDYAACWLEIRCEGNARGAIKNVVLLTDSRYSLDGRFVTIRKVHLLSA
ncbi:MAG: hypothetical protein ACJ71Q_15030 [Terriglobales bacterium]